MYLVYVRGLGDRPLAQKWEYNPSEYETYYWKQNVVQVIALPVADASKSLDWLVKKYPFVDNAEPTPPEKKVMVPQSNDEWMKKVYPSAEGTDEEKLAKHFSSAEDTDKSNKEFEDRLVPRHAHKDIRS